MQRGSAKNEIASKRKQAKPCSAGCFLIEEAKLSWLAGLAGMAGLAGLAGLTARLTARLTAKLIARGKELDFDSCHH